MDSQCKQCRKGQSEIKKLVDDKKQLEAALQNEREKVSQLTDTIARQESMLKV